MPQTPQSPSQRHPTHPTPVPPGHPCNAGSQSVLLELLEVPQLMDTCVRNGIHDEALDLQAFVFRLGLLHPDVPAVRLLVQQVGRGGGGPCSCPRPQAA